MEFMNGQNSVITHHQKSVLSNKYISVARRWWAMFLEKCSQRFCFFVLFLQKSITFSKLCSL